MGGSCYNKNLFVAFIILLALGVTNRVIIVVEAGELGTRVGFYSNTCPPAESIVRSTVEAHFRSKPSVAAGLLRLHFHDCFVRGCDASILISGPNTEQASPSNANLNGLEVIDDAKKFLEAACPGVVSCADILALAARDSVVLSGGVSWNVATGRRDGRVSKKWEPALNLAAHNDSIAAQKRKFARKGLTTKDLVTLVGGNHGFTVRQRDQIENGAHTIGTASCKLLSYSVGGANGSGGPYVNPKVVPKLRKLCPQNDPNRRVALDIDSEFKFDISYFANLKNGEAILRSELALWTDASTRIFVQKYLAPNVFNLQFGKSMLKMANIGVKTGLRGEIRTKCNAVN